MTVKDHLEVMMSGGAPAWPSGESETARAIRAHDWSATSLGPIEGWPASLRALVGMMLSCPQPMFLAWGPDLVSFFNDAYRPILGYRLDGALGTPFAKLWASIWDDIAPLVEATVRGESRLMRDMKLDISRAGMPEESWWTFSYSPALDDDGRVAGLFCVTNETTGRILAERSRAEAAARLDLALSAGGGIGAWAWDVPNDRVTSDARFARLYGVEPALAAKGAPIATFFGGIHPEDLPAVQEAIGRAMTPAGGDFAREYRLIGADGEVRWVVAQGRCQFDAEGRPVSFPGVSFDVTERHRVEDEVRRVNARLGEREAFLTSVLAASTDCIKVLDLEGRLTLMSEGGLKVMEACDPGDVVGRFWPDMLGSTGEGPDQAREAIGAARDGQETHFQSAALTFAGTPRWWDISVSPIRDGDGRVARILSVSRDRTALHEAQRQQEVVNQEISHRLKNTMAMVQAIASQTLRGVADQAPVEELTNRLMALSTAHDVLLARSWSLAPLREVVDSVLALFDHADRIHVEGPLVELSSRAALSLSLVLHELGTNALKHGALSGPEGRVEVRWTVEDRARPRVASDGASSGTPEPLLHFSWRELGGPPAVAPTRLGFGSKLLKMGLVGTGDAEIRYLSTGLEADMTAPVAQLTKA